MVPSSATSRELVTPSVVVPNSAQSRLKTPDSILLQTPDYIIVEANPRNVEANVRMVEARARSVEANKESVQSQSRNENVIQEENNIVNGIPSSENTVAAVGVARNVTRDRSDDITMRTKSTENFEGCN